MRQSKDQDKILSFMSLLQSYAKKKDIYNGSALHADLIEKRLLEKSPYLASALISMYAKCGALKKAREVLEELPIRNVVLWNTLISGYAQQGKAHEALGCFENMRREGISPDAITFISILKACGKIGAIDIGKHIEKETACRCLLKKSIALGNAFVDMYAKCGMVENARKVLEELPTRDVVSWNVIISGYAEQGQGHEALDCFQRMVSEGLSPDTISFICILKACGSVKAVEKGRQIHDVILTRGLLEKDIVLATALVNMYAKCGMIEKARETLLDLPVRDVVSWSAIITGCAQQGQAREALNCFEQMLSEGITPDVVTFACILKACGSTRELDKGELFHKEIVTRGMHQKDVILGTALVDMYAKCGVLAKANQMLQELSCRNAVSWNALIGGYVQHGQCHDALNCFERMKNEGLSPDAITFISVLKACGGTGALVKGKQIHDEIVSRGLLEKDIVLGTTLVDMYAKCGMITKAHKVLKELPIRNVVSWNALIAGYAEQGQCHEALNCLQWMQTEGLSPDKVTFVSILSACSHSGRLDEAQVLLENMTTKYYVIPKLEHHISMVVAFGCAGHFDQAMSVIKMMPSCDYPVIWRTILGACKKWGNVKLGKLAFDQSIQVDNTCASAYVLMAEIFAAAGMREDAQKVEYMRQMHTGVAKAGE